MTTPRTAALLWSGGKDSALALHHVRTIRSDLRIERLVTCVSQEYDRVSMHGVRRSLIEEQADAVGLPVEFVIIPSPQSPGCPKTNPGASFPSNDVYRTAMLAALSRLQAEGVQAVVFGDIFLEDLRTYRDRLLSDAGLVGEYPLWGRNTDELFEEFVALGFQTITVCVDTERLTEAHLGQPLDAAFRSSLPVGTDPCGERGEYHTFVIGGPPFRRPIRVRPGSVHRQLPFAFLEIHPG